ncbi:hypothetical protein [Micromonospora coxensis]|uniref:hypothetical protein n=1 Tax=Micromonospora coxensis TaxID=356852 RepID=UPI003422782E
MTAAEQIGDTGAPPGPPATGARRSRRRLPVLAAATLGALVLLGVGGYVGYDRYVRSDPGVTACAAMRDGRSPSGHDRSADGDGLTEAEYRAERQPFADSRYADIREHGTAVIDIGWQLSQPPTGQRPTPLDLAEPLRTHIAGLRAACADRGVTGVLDDR